MEGLKLLPVSFQDCSGLELVQQQRQNTAVVNAQLRGQVELAITPDKCFQLYIMPWSSVPYVSRSLNL